MVPAATVECKHCAKWRPTRMITFPVVSPKGKRHLAQVFSGNGKTYTVCGGQEVTDKWQTP